MQHVRPLRQPPTHSTRAPLEFRWQRFHKIAKELPPLFQRHWEEIALDQELIPLDPDWDSYFHLDQRRVLRVLTARADSELVGYIFNIVGPHLHYVSTRVAHTEMFWLDPAYRRGWEPVTMFKENIRGFRALEAKISTINFKLGYKNARVGKLLARLGYVPTDIVMRKVL